MNYHQALHDALHLGEVEAERVLTDLAAAAPAPVKQLLDVLLTELPAPAPVEPATPPVDPQAAAAAAFHALPVEQQRALLAQYAHAQQPATPTA